MQRENSESLKRRRAWTRMSAGSALITTLSLLLLATASNGPYSGNGVAIQVRHVD